MRVIHFSLPDEVDWQIELLNVVLTLLALFGLAFFQITIRQIKYLNNIVEQANRGIRRAAKRWGHLSSMLNTIKPRFITAINF